MVENGNTLTTDIKQLNSDLTIFIVGKEPYLFTGSFNTENALDISSFSGGMIADSMTNGFMRSDNIVYTSVFTLKRSGAMNLFPHASHALFWAEFTME